MGIFSLYAATLASRTRRRKASQVGTMAWSTARPSAALPAAAWDPSQRSSGDQPGGRTCTQVRAILARGYTCIVGDLTLPLP